MRDYPASATATEFTIGADAEGRSLENVADPLSGSACTIA
jgi:hypothetical protein